MSLLRGSLRKIALRPATRNTLIVLLILVVLVYLGLAAVMRALPPDEGGAELEAIFGFPDAFGTLAALLLTFGGLAAAAWAGALAGGEWTWNTFRSAVARGSSRPGYVLWTLAAVALAALVGWLLVFAVGAGAAIAGGAIVGGPVGDPVAAADRLPLLVLAGWWAVSMEAAIGFAVAFIARSQIAGIAVVVALYFGEQFGSIIIPPDLLRYAPVTAANTLVSAAGGPPGTALLAPLAVTTGYLVIAAAAAGLVARRSEIS